MNEVVQLKNETSYEIMENVIARGDLSKLTPPQRVKYYSDVCQSLGLNILTRPFQYITFDGKLTLYASKDCTEQLRSLKNISVPKIDKEVIGDIYCVTAYAVDKDGRQDVSTGAVQIKGLTGKALANAYKIAETQAKRRVTLSICGLGWMDESEIPDVPNAKPIQVDFETGEIKEPISNEAFLADIDIERKKLEGEIRDAPTMDILRKAFESACLLHINRVELMGDLIFLKDLRKAEIEKELNDAHTV